MENLDLVADICHQISAGFDCLGTFLLLLFWSRKNRFNKDIRQLIYQNMVSHFVSGYNDIKPIQIIDAIFKHWNSQPSLHSRQIEQWNWAFSLTCEPSSIGYACPSIKAWATQLIRTLRYTSSYPLNGPLESLTLTNTSYLYFIRNFMLHALCCIIISAVVPKSG
jgi:hypothetical protein